MQLEKLIRREKLKFKIFYMQIFQIYNLKSKWLNQIDFKINVKMKA